jgi:2-(1,2-epoxy-1,2-dihydrophenyl)acetyl-CoA isomerase
MGTPNSSVVYDVTEGVGTVRLNRPEAMNSLDIPTKELLRDTLVEAAADSAVRCVVLTGSGRAFCTGQDLKEHVRLLEEGRDDALSSTVELHYNPMVTAVATMEKPVIAAVNGVAAGAGASLAFACDVRVVAESAGFNMAFSNVALSCDTGSSYTLPRLVGPAKALELLYFPRTVKADEALALGLATQVVPDDELEGVVSELAVRLAAGPTVALASIRQSVAYAAQHTFAEALAFEGERMALTGGTADHRAAVAAFLAKEKPAFEGR